MTDEGEKRLMVRCDDCGSAFAGVETSDGRVLPIGSKASCTCGATSFSRISPDLLSDDDPDEAPGKIDGAG